MQDVFVFFYSQSTACDWCIGYWSLDVCSSVLFLHPRFWLLWLGLGLLWLVIQLPYRALLLLGGGLGALMYRVARSRRHIARRNLQLCFPEMNEKERERLLRENFASTGIAFFEMAMSWWWPKARLQRLAKIEGLEHLQQAQAEGQDRKSTRLNSSH